MIDQASPTTTNVQTVEIDSASFVYILNTNKINHGVPCFASIVLFAIFIRFENATIANLLE